MNSKIIAVAICSASALILGATSAQATVNSWGGADDGSAVGGATPGSNLGRAAFLADAANYGSVFTETFESSALGFGNFNIPGASVTLTGPDYGAGFSGVSNTTLGNLYGYDVGTGSGQWLGFADGSATFTFASLQHSFGFFTTGTQQVFDLSINLNDGNVSYNLASNVNGGAAFWGITDSVGFNSITISTLGGHDAWGIDNVSYNAAGAPEPATWAMVILGMAGVGASLRQRRRMVAA